MIVNMDERERAHLVIQLAWSMYITSIKIISKNKTWLLDDHIYKGSMAYLA